MITFSIGQKVVLKVPGRRSKRPVIGTVTRFYIKDGTAWLVVKYGSYKGKTMPADLWEVL